MKNYSFFSLMFFYSMSIFSQENKTAEYKTVLSSLDTDINNVGVWIPDNGTDKYIKGSVYLFPSWNDQYSLITKNGDSRKLVNLNYNIETKKLESLITVDSVFQYDLYQFDYVVQADKKYKVISNSQFNGLFFEVYNGDKIKLFRDVNIIVEKGIFNPLTQKKQEDKYGRIYSYYLLTNGNYEKVKLRRNVILKNVHDKKYLVKKFVSKNNLSYTSEADVSKILNYYNFL
ncbi:MAG: hypothetical protein ABWZ56_07615 [Flavobacterium sp.]